MEYRLGTCSSCKARYKVPATFTAARARCKTCGGAVEFGSVLSDVPRDPRPESARPSRPGPRREAAPPSPPPAPIPAATRPVRPPEPPAAPEAAPAQRSPAAPLPHAGESPRRAPTRERAAAPARVAAAAQKPRNWPLIIGSIVALIALVFAVVWFTMRDERESAAALEARKKEQALSAAAQAPAHAAAPAAPVEAAGESAVAAPGAKESPESPTKPAAPALPPADRALDADLAQLADFDLATLAEVEPLAGVDAAAQKELAAWVALFVDPASGAAGQRAADDLVARGKAALPPILNALKSVDVASDEGRRTGERIQKQLLMKICNGTNFGWKYDLEPASVAYNKKAIAMWFRAWEAARESDAAWSELARTAVDAPKEKLDDF